MSDKFGAKPSDNAFSKNKVLFENTVKGRGEIQAICAAQKLALVGTVITNKGTQVGCIKEMTVNGTVTLYVECAEW